MICSMKTTGGPCPGQFDLARRLEGLAARCLGECGYPILRRVECAYHNGTLTLRGRVPSYFLKQMAQAAVCRCAGIERVENCLQVDPETSPSEGNPRKNFM